VTQWVFSPNSRKNYCIPFTGIYFHYIFYCPFSRVSRFFCNFSYFCFPYIIQSSTNSLILQSMFLQISFTCTRYKGAPKTLLCGTSGITLTSLNSFLLTLGIPLPKRLTSNSCPMPPVSYAADHLEINQKPWKNQL